MQNKHFTLSKVEKLPESEVQITGEITLSFLVELRKEALKHLGKHVEISGFRCGHIPEDILVKHVGEMRVLEEAAELALGREYAHIVEEAQVSPIGRPEVSIVKLALGVPLEFKIKVAVEPEFKLPDYRKLAAEVGKRSDLENSERSDLGEVSDKEIEDTMAELDKRGIKPELKEGENLKEKVKESLIAQKNIKNQEKKRLTIIENLVKNTEIPVPQILIDTELNKMLAQFQGDVEGMGLKWADYLEQVKKKEEEIRDEWREQALSRVKAEIIISKIAVEEKIEPLESELEHEVSHLLSHYPDADPLRARIYIYSQLRNQKVLEFLETV
jgi:FKBP-type peptidyl-prolyl cis-trans isomerase (trigger factor)